MRDGYSQSWNPQLVNNGGILGPESIITGPDNEPIVLYAANNFLQTSRWNGTSWNHRISLDISNISGGFYHISAVRFSDTIYCVYRHSYIHAPIHYYTVLIRLDLNGVVQGSYQIPGIGAIEGLWQRGTVCMSATNQVLFAAAQPPSAGLRLWTFNTTTNVWMDIDTVDGSPGLGVADIATDSNGKIWIAYRDDTGQNLKVARSKDGGGWDTWFVDTEGNVGNDPQIIVDDNYVAHITYYDATNHRLKYATFLP